MEDQPFCFLTIKSIPLRSNTVPHDAPTIVCAAKRRLKYAQNFARTQKLPRKVNVGIASSTTTLFTDKSQVITASRQPTTDTLGQIFGPAYITHASKSPRERNSSIVNIEKPRWTCGDKCNVDGPAGTYATFAYLRINGKREPLPNRDHAAALLQELEHTVLIPICKHFGLRYHFFGEAHCQAKKAGMTIKDPLILKKEVPGSEGETVTELRGYLTTIRIRVRVHPSKGDPKTTFMNGGTLRAVLLHEIAHLRVMNHGKNFMLFLREVFQYAAEEIGVFKEHPPNEIPSPWPWENMIYQSLGKVSDEELIPVFDAHRAAEKAKLAKLALEEQGKEEEVKIEKPNDTNNEVNQEQQAEQEEPNEGPKTEEPNQSANNEVKFGEQDAQEEPNEVPKTEESIDANLLREVEPVEGPLEPSVSRTELTR